MSASFPWGDIVATPAALEACRHDDLQMLMGRHAQGDWGDVCEADKKMNDAALKIGARLLSCYVLMGGEDRIWIITESDESRRRIPAIALTAFARTEDRTRAMLAGYNVHLSKPIEPVGVSRYRRKLDRTNRHSRSLEPSTWMGFARHLTEADQVRANRSYRRTSSTVPAAKDRAGPV